MNDLIRPTLYEAHHDILPVREAATAAQVTAAKVVGRAGVRNRRFPGFALVRQAALQARRSAGDHDRGGLWRGAVRHLQRLPAAGAEVLVKGDQYAVVRPHLEVEDLIALDRPPHGCGLKPWDGCRSRKVTPGGGYAELLIFLFLFQPHRPRSMGPGSRPGRRGVASPRGCLGAAHHDSGGLLHRLDHRGEVGVGARFARCGSHTRPTALAISMDRPSASTCSRQSRRSLTISPVAKP